MAAEDQGYEVDDFGGNSELDQGFNEDSPLVLEVLAGLQPSQVEEAFGWTNNSSEGRRPIAATVVTEHAFKHHGPNSTQELAARIEYIQNDNKMFSIHVARAVHT